ncbi:hypothetical protein GTY67_23295 [Streptomyces sp. SID8374]|uniref:hypothetical protein n=1 Tax=Streptomyces sp. SID8374 TaxID=2690354 RepID=UPI00136F578F|nr:hypothetical protein [Streptomyces sp. SID8374]MYX16283.1 hypothetical protein [Streptomyces sp. SID8374]
MRDLDYVAAVTVTAGGRALWLGGIAVPNRRLVLRWLRRQALRLADGHGRDLPPPAPWLRARDVRQVAFHGTDAPEGLRAWAGDEGRQGEAISALESGRPALLTVVDPAVGLRVTLAGWPVGPDRPSPPSPYRPRSRGRGLVPPRPRREEI